MAYIKPQSTYQVKPLREKSSETYIMYAKTSKNLDTYRNSIVFSLRLVVIGLTNISIFRSRQPAVRSLGSSESKFQQRYILSCDHSVSGCVRCH